MSRSERLLALLQLLRGHRYAITGTDDNKQAEQVSSYLDKTDFDLALRTIVTQARIHMYGVAEVSKDEIGRFKMVAVPSVNLVPTYGEDGWLEFDYVPEEHEVRAGHPDYTGRLCVIGAELKEDGLAELFGV